MESRTIGSLSVSVVGLGCTNFGTLVGRRGTYAVVRAALDSGITLFDTADCYGEAKGEEFLGAALGSKRDEIVLATKFGVPHGSFEGGASPAYIRSSVENSLRRIGTDRIDLYQLHLPDGKTPISDTLGALAELVVEGKVREIGCSNFDHAKLEEAESAVAKGSPGFASVQNRYSLLHREPEEGVLQYCDRTKTAFLPYYPLASGVLTGKYRSGEAPPEGTRMAAWSERAKTELTDERLATVTELDVLARNEGHTVLDLAFGWLLSHASVASVIAGATKPEQVASNVAASQWKPDAELLAHADRISRR